jgi:hypothetical protein
MTYNNMIILAFATTDLYPMWKLYYGTCNDEIWSPLQYH